MYVVRAEKLPSGYVSEHVEKSRVTQVHCYTLRAVVESEIEESGARQSCDLSLPGLILADCEVLDGQLEDLHQQQVCSKDSARQNDVVENLLNVTESLVWKHVQNWKFRAGTNMKAVHFEGAVVL